MFTDNASFTKISNMQLEVSKFIQKAVIEIDEEGSQDTDAAGKFMIFIHLCALFIYY